MDESPLCFRTGLGIGDGVSEVRKGFVSRWVGLEGVTSIVIFGPGGDGVNGLLLTGLISNVPKAQLGNNKNSIVYKCILRYKGTIKTVLNTNVF